MTAKEKLAFVRKYFPYTPMAGVERQPEDDRTPRSLSSRDASRELGLPERLVERTMRPKRG